MNLKSYQMRFIIFSFIALCHQSTCFDRLSNRPTILSSKTSLTGWSPEFVQSRNNEIDNDSNIKTVKLYFELWNQRDMVSASKLFDANCVYEDTLYPKIFYGNEELKKHLVGVAKSLPDSFKFVIDSYSEDEKSRKVGVQWHVEADGTPLPFTRGCSMYTLNDKGQIIKGFDVPEPTLKSGSFSLGLLRLLKPLIVDRNRIFPAVAWIAYMYFLFF